MIKSKFIYDVLEASLNFAGTDQPSTQGIQYWKLTRPQVKFLTDTNYRYTGKGLLVNFTFIDEARNYKSPVKDGSFEGITIKSPDLDDYATTDIYFNDGIIDCLEIFSVAGDYPKRDLDNYTFHTSPVGDASPKYLGKPLPYIKQIAKHLFKK